MKYNRGFLKFPHMKKRLASDAKYYLKVRWTGQPSLYIRSPNSPWDTIAILKFRYSWGEMVDIYLADDKTIVGEIFALKGRIKFFDKEKQYVSTKQDTLLKASQVQNPDSNESQAGRYLTFGKSKTVSFYYPNADKVNVRKS